MNLTLRSLPARIVVGVIVAAVLAAIGWYAYEAVRPGRVNLIRPSYAFDLTDREQVAGHADNIFIARVDGIAGVDADRGPRTIFRVTVVENIKGNLTGTVLVRQLGGKVGKDVWVVENDQALAVGSTYVLATKQSLQQKGAQVLLAGPLGHEIVATSVDRQAALTVWRDAVRNQRRPATVPD